MTGRTGKGKLGPLALRTTPEGAYDALRRAILSGQFAPGERLVEAHLAADLGISRAPVREAFSRLEEEGLVTRLPFRGTFVSEVSAATVAEIAALRLILEPYAVSCAADRLGDELAPHVVACLDDLRAAVKSGDAIASIDAHLAFHRLFYEQSGNAVLEELWSGWETRMRLFLVLDQQALSDLSEIGPSHEHLAELALQGRMDEFRNELAHHVHKAPGEPLVK